MRPVLRRLFRSYQDCAIAGRRKYFDPGNVLLMNSMREMIEELLAEKTLERETGFEPATSTLARSHSTAELLPLVLSFYCTCAFGANSLHPHWHPFTSRCSSTSATAPPFGRNRSMNWAWAFLTLWLLCT
jgi:hypothetical protein